SRVSVLREGGQQSVIGTARDNAGTTNSVTVDGINIDKTPPLSTASLSPTPTAKNWLAKEPRLTLTASDTVSGGRRSATASTNLLRRLTCRCQVYLQPLPIRGDSVHTVYLFAKDVAGNVDAVRKLEVGIDTKPPTTSAKR